MSPEFRWHYLKTALFVTTFTSCLSVIGSQCTNNHILVPNCPGSTYDWNLLAFVFCVDAKQYHCLITENHNAANPEMIQCCMRPQNISKGHMPRYNKRKETLQEIPCEEEYYMPTHFESNRYRDNGAEHCKYKKSSCVDMEGMKVFDNGSPTEDRKCYCDYLNNYKPELPLDENVSYFLEKDNRCVMSKDCNTTYQELGMMYQCIDKCKQGEYRPEMQMGCMRASSTESPTTSVTISDSSSSVETKTDRYTTPLTKTTIETTTADTMVKPIMSNANDYRDLIINILVPVVVILLLIIMAVLIFLCFRKKRAEEQGIFCCTWDNTFLHYHNPSNVIVGDHNQVQVKNGGKSPDEKRRLIEEGPMSLDSVHEQPVKASFKVFQTSYTAVVTKSVKLIISVSEADRVEWYFVPEQLGNSETLITENSKYSIEALPNPSLTIKNISKTDSGYFTCKAFIDDRAFDSEHMKLEVKVPYIHLKKESLNVEIGGTKAIECNIDNKPEKFEIFWEKAIENNDFERIDMNKDKYEGVETDHPHLRVLNAEISDTGYYRCCLTYQTNEEWEPVRSSKAHLHVHEGKKTGNMKVGQQINVYAQNVENLNAGSKSQVAVGAIGPNKEDDDSSDLTEDGSSSDSDNDENNTGALNSKAESIEENSPESNEGSRGYVSENLNKEVIRRSREESSCENLHKDDKEKFKNISPSLTPVGDIERIAAKHKFSVKNVHSDGNCMFHAIALQLLGNKLKNKIGEEKAKELRFKTVEFLRNNDSTPDGEKYSSFLSVTEEWGQYLNNMNELGTYGDEIILKAVSHCFNVSIWVLSTQSPKTFTKYNNDNGDLTVYLGFIHDKQHYVRLVPSGNSLTESSC